MEDSLFVQQQEQTGERTADDAVSANMFASEVEKTEDLLLSPERLLDQAKGEELFLLCVVVATCCCGLRLNSQPAAKSTRRRARARTIDDIYVIHCSQGLIATLWSSLSFLPACYRFSATASTAPELGI